MMAETGVENGPEVKQTASSGEAPDASAGSNKFQHAISAWRSKNNGIIRRLNEPWTS